VIGTTTTIFSFPPQTSSSSCTITTQPPTLPPSSHQTSDGSRNPYTKWVSSSPSPLLSVYRMWNNSCPPIGRFCQQMQTQKKKSKICWAANRPISIESSWTRSSPTQMARPGPTQFKKQRGQVY
jgi:hypothetical protein